jgi:prevent-host-death family protein
MSLLSMQKKQMQVSTFKAKCIAAVREVQRSGTPLVVTLRGEPLVVVEPVLRTRQLGALRGEVTFRGDLVETGFAHEWEMNA